MPIVDTKEVIIMYFKWNELYNNRAEDYPPKYNPLLMDKGYPVLISCFSGDN